MRNLGAIALARSGQTIAAVAKKCSVSVAAVGYWRSGAKRPGPAKRAILFEWLGIPAPSWDEYPAPAKKRTAGAPPPETLVAPPPAAPGAASLVLELERQIQSLLETTRTDPKSTPLERAKVLASLSGPMNVLGKLTGNYELGRRLFKLPIWQRCMRELTATLRQYPDAAAACARTFARLEAEHEGTPDITPRAAKGDR